MVKLSADGTSFTGKNIPCGSTVPELTLASIVGGGKVSIEVPNAVWDMQPALEFPVTGTISGSSYTQDGSSALVGLTMTDPNAAWPTSYTSITAADVDKDGKPGLTGIPKGGGGYVNPPVSIMGSRADQVDLASRTQISLKGTFTSCTEQSGDATTKFLDNHIVACHVVGGSDCTANQVKFLDDNRTAYIIGSGSYVAKIVPDNASCSDVRAALP
jgi:hypothetical protein